MGFEERVNWKPPVSGKTGRVDYKTIDMNRLHEMALLMDDRRGRMFGDQKPGLPPQAWN
jgi:hypothetical protein